MDSSYRSSVDKMKPEDCRHFEFTAQVQVNRLKDSGKFIADVTIHCLDCGSPMRFVGLHAGISFERPTVSIDELELHVPIEPEGEKRLQTTAS